MTRSQTILGMLLVVAFAFLPVGAADGVLSGAEICSGGSCNGWVLGYQQNTGGSQQINNGPTSGSACNGNGTYVGFAVGGSNNMCQSNAKCDSCTVYVPAGK